MKTILIIITSLFALASCTSSGDTIAPVSEQKTENIILALGDSLTA
ncbi:MAG: hypothetical protein WAW59_04955 [Patescibacteria group bacterium]